MFASLLASTLGLMLTGHPQSLAAPINASSPTAQTPAGQSQPTEPPPATLPDPTTTPSDADQAATDSDVPAEPAREPQPEPERDPIKRLLSQIELLRAEVQMARQQLAEAVLHGAAAQRELNEIKQFLADHDQYGTDFEKYKAIKEIAQREAKQREMETARARRDLERARREARMKVARAEHAAREAEQRKVARYRRSGFSPLGLDVYSGKWAYFYESTDTTRSRIDYQPGIGNYVRLYPDKTINYSSMTISGSIINGADEVRNIGVALAFFDEHGNQVGHETVQINNARPDVPYPFTSTIEMALDRPFDSSSTYVLYADAAGEPMENVEPEPVAPPVIGNDHAPAYSPSNGRPQPAPPQVTRPTP